MTWEKLVSPEKLMQGKLSQALQSRIGNASSMFVRRYGSVRVPLSLPKSGEGVLLHA